MGRRERRGAQPGGPGEARRRAARPAADRQPRADERARHRLRPSSGGWECAVALRHGDAPARQPAGQDDLHALLPARPHRRRALPGRADVHRQDQCRVRLLRPVGDPGDGAVGDGPPDPLPDRRQLRGLPPDRGQARWRLGRRRQALLERQHARLRLVRDDQPAPRLSAPHRLAGALLRPLQAHGLGPLPARAAAALRQGAQASRELEVEADGDHEDRRGDARERADRPGRRKGRRHRDAQVVRALRVRPSVRKLRPGEDRRADGLERPDAPIRRTSRPPSRSSRPRTSKRPRRRPSRSASARECEKWVPRAPGRPRSSS